MKIVKDFIITFFKECNLREEILLIVFVIAIILTIISFIIPSYLAQIILSLIAAPIYVIFFTYVGLILGDIKDEKRSNKGDLDNE
jgi:ABC-type polysaccharide/polyol phosphate export permease